MIDVIPHKEDIDPQWTPVMLREVVETTYRNTAQAISKGVSEEELLTLVLGHLDAVKKLRGNSCSWRDQGEGGSARLSPSLRNTEEVCACFGK